MTTRATKYVAQQLKELLGTYVEGVTEDSLNLQLLGGKLKLENLRIRETALADLELPFKCSGTVGKMELTVNLLRFWWNEPVIIGLEDVELNLDPLDQGEELCPSRFAAHFERIRLWKEGQVGAPRAPRCATGGACMRACRRPQQRRDGGPCAGPRDPRAGGRRREHVHGIPRAAGKEDPGQPRDPHYQLPRQRR